MSSTKVMVGRRTKRRRKTIKDTIGTNSPWFSRFFGVDGSLHGCTVQEISFCSVVGAI
jgi:hypothetical protein